ncbi:glycosyltransferase family 2 protein [Microbulbifer hainanensis]|uniref:glycosyltransferase family 2 protein n=1 Tax=Microbulbifer hainanensis TaxID=2735675 RepID=UPI0018660CC7|nr:glycosyltransferase [Microbulbifer hainanensis]
MLQQVKDLLRPLKAPKFHIDHTAGSRSGVVITGWYASKKILDITVIDSDGNEVLSSIGTHPREDVAAAYRMDATGFNIHCATATDPAELQLSFLTAKGKQKIQELVNSHKSAVNKTSIKKIRNNAIISKDHDSAGHVEFALYDEQTLFISGWLASKAQFSFFEVEQRKEALGRTDDSILWHPRKDIFEALKKILRAERCNSFTATINLSNPINKSYFDELFLKVKFGDHDLHLPIGEAVPLLKDQKNSLVTILNSWDPLLHPDRDQCIEVLKPALSKLYRHTEPVASEQTFFGKPPASPKSSILIPLYGRFDFLRYQISRFSNQASLREHEVIFIVDDPSIDRDVKVLSEEIYHIFQFPFSVLSLERNVGFGRANNIGASVARSENLILLNSDVIPVTNNWAEVLVSDLNESPGIGIIGSRLLFEDGTIQHDGMTPMVLKQYPGTLFNDHPGKGKSAPQPKGEQVLQECPLVTAACIAVKKSVFENVGGFDADYILGDFEDSDLCLKILETGRRNCIRRDLEIYHLERQSQNLVEPGDWKHRLTIYNALVYNQRWSSRLNELYPEFSGVYQS